MICWGRGCQRRASAALPRERDPVLKAVWAPGAVWTGAEYLAPTGFEPQTVQPVPSSIPTELSQPTNLPPPPPPPPPIHQRENPLCYTVHSSVFTSTSRTLAVSTCVWRFKNSLSNSHRSPHSTLLSTR